MKIGKIFYWSIIDKNQDEDGLIKFNMVPKSYFDKGIEFKGNIDYEELFPNIKNIEYIFLYTSCGEHHYDGTIEELLELLKSNPKKFIENNNLNVRL